jgi:D-ribose pyranase
MLKSGILNPQINALLSRFRHTNTLVISDRGFPYWPQLETIDIALTDDIPTVDDVLSAVLKTVQVGPIFMAEEFRTHNRPEVLQKRFHLTAKNIAFEPHIEFKRRVPAAIGLIRTADTTPYANIILESA